MTFTSSYTSPKGLEIASLISWARSCCSVMSCIMSSILSMLLKKKKGVNTFKKQIHSCTEKAEHLFYFYIPTCLCGPSPGPGQQSPCSSEPLCWCVSSPKLLAETLWWTVCRRFGQAAAPGASFSSRPAGQLLQKDPQWLHFTIYHHLVANFQGWAFTNRYRFLPMFIFSLK